MAGSSSSRRHRRRRGSGRSSKRRSRRERRSKPVEASSRRDRDRDADEDRYAQLSATSPPSYSVEENSSGEWVNSRLNLKWPAQVPGFGANKHRYLSLADDDDSTSDRKQRERRSRKRKDKSSKKEKKRRSERKKREQSKKPRTAPASTTARSPLPAGLISPPPEKEAQYIMLSTGSEAEESSAPVKRPSRRDRKRMTVQTSPQVSKRSGFTTDESGKKVDSIVFDTRSEMLRYSKSNDVVGSKKKRASGGNARAKKPQAADHRENEEYNRYYVGVRSRRNVESKLKQPGDFRLYYEKPGEDEVPSSVNLMIAYLSSGSQPYHFPIQCFEDVEGHKHYVVMQNKSDGKMFTSILSLVKHYSLYSHVDTTSGRLDTFAVPH